MRKYGIEHFHVSLIEETDKPEERERYWIEELGSFKYGYNATLGGDGKPYLDYNLVIATYRQLKNQTEVSKKLGICVDSIRAILKSRNEHIYSTSEIQQKTLGKVVNMFDLQENYLRSFPTLYAAATYMIENNLTNCKHSTIRTHISEVCKNKRKTAAGFIWKFDNNYEQ